MQLGLSLYISIFKYFSSSKNENYPIIIYSPFQPKVILKISWLFPTLNSARVFEAPKSGLIKAF